MDRGGDERREIRLYEGSTALHHAEGWTQKSLRRCRAQADENLWLDQRELRVEPGPADPDLDRIGLLVDALLAARLPLEMLDDVGDVGLRPVDAGLLQAGVEESSRGTHEGPPFDVFAVAGLLADQDHQGVPLSLSEDSLRASLPEGTGAAVLSRLPQPVKRRPFGNERESHAFDRCALWHALPASIERAN